MKRVGRFSVYIVECVDGTYYTGCTNDIENRIKLHNSGHGAKYLRGKTPVKIVYAKEYTCYKNALKAEIAIKKLSHKEKQRIVDSAGEARRIKAGGMTSKCPRVYVRTFGRPMV